VSSALGGTIGDVLLRDRQVFVVLPSMGRMFSGPLDRVARDDFSRLTMELSFGNYQWTGDGYIPTQLYGHIKCMDITFEVRLKDTQIDVPIMPEAFEPVRGEYDWCPLDELWLLLSGVVAE
jgi:hypothetical protein